MSLGQALLKAVLDTVGLGTNNDLLANSRGALWVALDNNCAQGCEAVDLSSADAIYNASTNMPAGIRAIRVGVGGAGALKLDCPKLDGITSGTVTLQVADGDVISIQGISKIWKTGTDTATAGKLHAYR